MLCDSHLLGLILQFQILSTPFAFAWKNKKSEVASLNKLVRKKHCLICCFMLLFDEWSKQSSTGALFMEKYLAALFQQNLSFKYLLLA